MVNGQLPLLIFGLVGMLAVASGGLLAAFSARKPSRLAAWASSYLVLVAGLLQVGIGASLYYLVKSSAAWLTILAFIAFNLGNAGVLLGTVLKNRSGKYRILVDIGGGLLAISMILLLILVHGAAMSWQLLAFYIIVAIILVTMPIGLILSRRRKGRLKNSD